MTLMEPMKAFVITLAAVLCLCPAYSGMAVAEDAAPVNPASVSATPSRMWFLVPTPSNKRVQGSDFHVGVFLQAIWFDISWDTSRLKKATRLIKGDIIINDTRGEEKVRFARVIRNTLSPRQLYFEKGIGFEYDPDNGNHQWIRAAALEDMSFRFEVAEVIYQDGTVETF